MGWHFTVTCKGIYRQAGGERCFIYIRHKFLSSHLHPFWCTCGLLSLSYSKFFISSWCTCVKKAGGRTLQGGCAWFRVALLISAAAGTPLHKSPCLIISKKGGDCAYWGPLYICMSHRRPLSVLELAFTICVCSLMSKAALCWRRNDLLGCFLLEESLLFVRKEFYRNYMPSWFLSLTSHILPSRVETLISVRGFGQWPI